MISFQNYPIKVACFCFFINKFYNVYKFFESFITSFFFTCNCHLLIAITILIYVFNKCTKMNFIVLKHLYVVICNFWHIDVIGGIFCFAKKKIISVISSGQIYTYNGYLGLSCQYFITFYYFLFLLYLQSVRYTLWLNLFINPFLLTYRGRAIGKKYSS